MLSVEGVVKSYGEHLALDGVDLRIEPGEVCALLGPNGAGKTTLASIVAGLKRPDRGSVSVAGVDVVRFPYRARTHLGYAPQELGVYPLASVRDNLRLFGGLAGLRGARLEQRVCEVAELLGLTQLLDTQGGLMSGGEQRRLHTAMALLHRPDLLLLDEPTVGADVATRGLILAFVRSLARDGAAVCYSTHYLAEVEELDATVALIHHGRVIARGGVAELVASYGESSVQMRFAGPAPDLGFDRRRVAVDGDRLRLATTEPAADAAAAMAAAADLGAEVCGLEIVRPSLDSVFMALTGRRFAEADSESAGGAGSSGDGSAAEAAPKEVDADVVAP